MIGQVTKLVLKRKKMGMVKPKLDLVMHDGIKVKTGTERHLLKRCVLYTEYA